MSSIIRWQYSIVSGVRPYRAKLIVLMALIGGIAFSSAGVMAKSEMLGPLNLSPLQSTLTEPQAKTFGVAGWFWRDPGRDCCTYW